jgi:hypothetical protein
MEALPAEPAPVEKLVDQGASCAANKGVPSNFFVSISSFTRALDDIIVPAGKTWSISSINVMGAWFGASHLTEETEFGIAIFNRNHIMCREDIKIPAFSGATEGVPTKLQLSYPCVLVGGHLDATVPPSLIAEDETYYMTVFPKLNFGEGGNTWHWSYSLKTFPGDSFKFRDMDNILQLPNNCRSWTDATKCELGLTGPTDLCFTVEGYSRATTSDDVTELDKPKLPVTDGDIGTDVGHSGRMLTGEEAQHKVDVSGDLSSSTNAALHDQSPVVESSLDNERPAYVIPLAVVGSILGFALVVLVLALLLKKKPAPERV